jgi:hypothetical protein
MNAECFQNWHHISFLHSFIYRANENASPKIRERERDVLTELLRQEGKTGAVNWETKEI